MDEPLHLMVAENHRRTLPETRWVNDEDGQLEKKVGPIVVEFFFLAETSYRSFREREQRNRHDQKAYHLKRIQEARAHGCHGKAFEALRISVTDIRIAVLL